MKNRKGEKNSFLRTNMLLNFALWTKVRTHCASLDVITLLKIVIMAILSSGLQQIRLDVNQQQPDNELQQYNQIVNKTSFKVKMVIKRHNYDGSL